LNPIFIQGRPHTADTSEINKQRNRLLDMISEFAEIDIPVINGVSLGYALVNLFAEIDIPVITGDDFSKTKTNTI
jgi:hypothetical protein